jgi:hypothetical protein
MQEGIQLPELLARIKVLREAGLRAEHVAFSFMKRRIQPLMAQETLGFEYTDDDDTSRMPGGRAGRQRHRREVVAHLQGHAAVHGVSGRGVLRRAPAQGGE